MTAQSTELNEAKGAVLRFARAWTEWEVLMARKRNSLTNPALRKARSKLIQNHCTPKKRVYVDEPTPMSFREPPTYGAVVEANLIHMELASPTKAFVDSKSPLTFHRFVVV